MINIINDYLWYKIQNISHLVLKISDQGKKEKNSTSTNYR